MSEKSTISTGPEGCDDAPHLTREIAERAELAIGGRVIRAAVPPLGRRRGRPPKPEGERKEAVSLRLDPDVLAHFRAAGEGWQTRINEALAGYVKAASRSRVAEEREGFRGKGEK
jgi:uncharacterized protein (DUF4415 family)